MLAWVQVTGAPATYKDKEKGGGAECRMKGWGKGMRRTLLGWSRGAEGVLAAVVAVLASLGEPISAVK